ncbi:MAG: glycosyltransferase family 39 protein [Bacteroidota bacterium]
MKQIAYFRREVVIGLLFLVVIGWLVGLSYLPLFDWDEINFAEIAREMLATGEFLQPTINYAPFHEKPPLFAWLQVGSFRLWGVGSLGARFPNVVCGVFTLLTLWWWGRRLWGEAFGRWWAAFLGLSILPALYFRSGIIDPWFNLFILLALLPSLTGARLTAGRILAGGWWLGLAVLTKGPAAGLIAGLCWACLLLFRKESRLPRVLCYLGIGLLSLVPIGIWLAFLWRVDDGFFAREFLQYQWRLFFREDAGHGGFPGYHVVVLLLGCFPASVYALPLLWARPQVPGKVADGGMRILFWVVLILFSVVSTKIVHYSSLCYFPLAYFAARWVTDDLGAVRTERRVRRGIFAIWSLYLFLALVLPLLGSVLPALIWWIEDQELVSRLRLPVVWPWYTAIPGLLIGAGIIVLYRIKNRPRHLRAGAQLLLAWLFLTLALPVFAPRIQQYTQGAAVEFYRELAGRDVYLGTAYYKSYAHWFYAELAPEVYDAGCRERQCRFHGPIAKPLYFSSPLRKKDRVLREVPDAELLYARGGFAFYYRPATP